MVAKAAYKKTAEVEIIAQEWSGILQTMAAVVTMLFLITY